MTKVQAHDGGGTTWPDQARHEAGLDTDREGGRDDTPVVIAVVRNDETADRVLSAAIERGIDSQARVILYDIDAKPSLFESPLPTDWSSEDLDRRIPPALTAKQLDDVGQSGLATRVRALTEAGIEAYGWLPESGAPDELARYADGMDATEVLTIASTGPTADDLSSRGVKGVRSVD
jgi:hypothetical protein